MLYFIKIGALKSMQNLKNMLLYISHSCQLITPADLPTGLHQMSQFSYSTYASDYVCSVHYTSCNFITIVE